MSHYVVAVVWHGTTVELADSENLEHFGAVDDDADEDVDAGVDCFGEYFDRTPSLTSSWNAAIATVVVAVAGTVGTVVVVED